MLPLSWGIGSQRGRLKELEASAGADSQRQAIAEGKARLQALEQIERFAIEIRNGRVPGLPTLDDVAPQPSALVPTTPRSLPLPVISEASLQDSANQTVYLDARPIYRDTDPAYERTRLVSCQRCRHFREVRQPSQILAAEVKGRQGSAISEALEQISADEGRQIETEAQFKIMQSGYGRDTWGFRPVMSEFCSVHEPQGVYYICEVKNRDQQCPDFSPGLEAARSCSTCANRVELGPSKDQQEMRDRIRATGDISRGWNPDMSRAADIWKGYNNLIDHSIPMRIAYELQAAYRQKGVFADEPEYLEYCQKFSEPKRKKFHVCAMLNPHDTCTAWRHGKAQLSASALEAKKEDDARKKAEQKPSKAGKVAGALLGVGAVVGGIVALNEAMKAQTPPESDASQAAENSEPPRT